MIDSLSSSVNRAGSAFVAGDWITFFDASALPLCIALHVFMWFWSLGVFHFFLGLIVLAVSVVTFVIFLLPSGHYQSILDEDQFRHSVSNIYHKYNRQRDNRRSSRIFRYVTLSYYVRSRSLKSQEKKVLKQYTNQENLYRPSIASTIWAIFLNPLTILSWILTRLSIIDRKTAVFVIIMELLMLFMMNKHATRVTNAEKRQLTYALECTQSASINNPANVKNTAYVNTRAYREEMQSMGLAVDAPKWFNK